MQKLILIFILITFEFSCNNRNKSMMYETKISNTKNKVLILGCGNKFDELHNHKTNQNVEFHTLDINSKILPTYLLNVNDIDKLKINANTYDKIILEYLPFANINPNTFHKLHKILKEKGILKILGLPTFIHNNGRITDYLFWSINKVPRNSLSYPIQNPSNIILNKRLYNQLISGAPYFHPNTLGKFSCILKIANNKYLYLITSFITCCFCCNFCCKKCIPFIDYCFLSKREKVKKNFFIDINDKFKKDKEINDLDNDKNSLKIIENHFIKFGLQLNNQNSDIKNRYLIFYKIKFKTL